MKRRAVRASILVLLVLFLVATLLVSAFHPWVQLRLAEYVLTGLSERSGGEITVETVYVRPSGVFRFSGFRVAGADGSPLIAVDRGQGAINVRALLQRSVELEPLVLAGVELNLRRDEEGALNVVDLARSLSPAVTDAQEPGEGSGATEQKPWSVELADAALLDGDVELSFASDAREAVHAEGVSLSVERAAFSPTRRSLHLGQLAVRSLNGVE
ncbi:MAG: hypothetical protein ACLFPO_10690, partial [Spirochaetaceae bacterium]